MLESFKMSYLDGLELWYHDNAFLAYARLFIILLITMQVGSWIWCKYKRHSCEGIQAQLLRAFEENKIVEIIEILNSHPNIINQSILDTGYTPFMIACSLNETLLVKVMLSKGADIHKNTPHNDSVFYLAIFHYIRNPGNLDASCIRELYYAGCDINAPNGNGYTPLQMAAMFGHTALVNWLLNKNGSVSVYPHPIAIASSYGHLETAELISNWVISQEYMLN
ncbi:serine/threonine-protein phosphatase 6 regulatory ankyrin repeat subunit C-like [Aethina tumida]|uniref:serine/threonine-protein phosphatase 6 regulatory ankyrin repeat subunit C-like n=1 Tax=Aethina tumida TaxID=116153 RepID=UPI002148D26F|nr:serine/threonine-protein phosphatase 6 regulatory ankyrin repeat subunit C-like [Aethina tumida]